MIEGSKPAASDVTPDVIIEPVAGEPVTVKILVNGKEYLETVPAAAADVVGGVTLVETTADSVATTAEGLVTDFNALLAKLRAAGVIAPNAEE